MAVIAEVGSAKAVAVVTVDLVLTVGPEMIGKQILLILSIYRPARGGISKGDSRPPRRDREERGGSGKKFGGDRRPQRGGSDRRGGRRDGDRRGGRGGRGDDRLPKDKDKAQEILDKQLMQFQAKNGGNTEIFKHAQ